MRLVDADKLQIKYDGHTVGVWKNDLDNAPIVNAIPIEWILNHPKFPHKNEDRKKCILDMIADWEKENGLS